MSVQKSVFVIASYTFQESLRNRLFTMTAVGLICLLGLTEFIGELAITESRQIQASLVGSVMRLFTVVTVILFVLTSMSREIHDKGLELILAMPLRRSVYYTGKFTGYCGLALAITVFTGVLLLIYADPLNVLAWIVSLLLECMLLIALSMLCVFTFTNVTVSFIVVLAFYLLSRSIAAIQLISQSPILQTEDFAQEFMQGLVNVIAYVLPDLADYTRSEWLVYGLDETAFYDVVVQTVIYMSLLIAAGLFDLYRKDL